MDNIQKLRKAFKLINPDIVIHLSAYGNNSYHSDPLKMINVNIIQTVNLILALEEIDYRCLINTGSSSEYGFKSKAMKETDEAKPTSFYAATKLSSTAFCTMHAKSRNKPIITVRPFSVYGPYEEKNRLIPTVINNIINNKPIKLTPQDVKRDFIFVDDLIEGYIKISTMMNKSLCGEVFNLGSGKQCSNSQIVTKLTKILKKEPKIINILFVCSLGVLRSPRNAKAFSEYILSKKLGHRFNISYSGSRPASVNFKSKILFADIVVAFSPKIASEVTKLTQSSKIKPEVLVFGEIGGSTAKTNYSKLASHAIDKFGH